MDEVDRLIAGKSIDYLEGYADGAKETAESFSEEFLSVVGEYTSAVLFLKQKIADRGSE